VTRARSRVARTPPLSLWWAPGRDDAVPPKAMEPHSLRVGGVGLFVLDRREETAVARQEGS
jgi:hypothetical protein